MKTLKRIFKIDLAVIVIFSLLGLFISTTSILPMLLSPEQCYDDHYYEYSGTAIYFGYVILFVIVMYICTIFTNLLGLLSEKFLGKEKIARIFENLIAKISNTRLGKMIGNIPVKYVSALLYLIIILVALGTAHEMYNLYYCIT